MLELIVTIVGVSIGLLLLVAAFALGGYVDRKHLANLAERERLCQSIQLSQSQHFFSPHFGGSPPQIVTAETVVANNHFKRFLASWRKFFGGEIKSFHVLVERARRETLMRLVENAQQQGFNALCNVRLDSVDIGGNTTAQGMSCICILGTATAYHSSTAKPMEATII
ncbi:MAG TPA: heavy metal-binding domain-containing protein [Pirellulaceae bacterium]|nr:heavy metal-binding domain-containing protein [Pirellulaceae bacterium]HMO92000.1 heavy metal-binding domain-containing protein [Pirellulaceae bacterium]HMP68799.1 heavy metal-binding domain-containing protein [Pirellulaceae bacterium]